MGQRKKIWAMPSKTLYSWQKGAYDTRYTIHPAESAVWQRGFMLYMILGTLASDSGARRAAARPEHLDRLRALRDEGRLVLAGPCPAVDSPDPGPAGYNASLIVAEFPSLAAGHTWASEDPYARAAVYEDVAVRPFCQVLP